MDLGREPRRAVRAHAGPRGGVTYTSQIKLDVEAPAQLSGLGPGFSALFASRGLGDARFKLGVTVPQQALASVCSPGHVSLLLPVNAAWRFGPSAGQQLTKTPKWGIAGAVIYGGTLDVEKASILPPALGGRGNLVGSYDNTASIVVSAYGNWSF